MLMYRGLRGSRLHGFAVPDSDYDWIEIWDHISRWDYPPWGQTIDGHTDTVRAELSEFMRWAVSGSPMALETIFSPDEAIEFDVLKPWRHAFRPDLRAAQASYGSPIRRFQHSENAKHRRHAARLQYDLDSLLTYGYFDPAGYAKSLK